MLFCQIRTGWLLFKNNQLHPKYFELHEGDKQMNPDELTYISDSGE
jgi:hypothetical protein